MKKTIFILTLLLPVCFLFAQSDNNSKVYSNGIDNEESFVSQVGVGLNESDVWQLGNENSVVVDQTNDYLEQYDENWSNIRQNGNGNTAAVQQIVTTSPYLIKGGTLDADVDQIGDGNDAVVKQQGLWLNAKTQQNGDNGNAIQNQGMTKYSRKAALLSDANILQRTGVDRGSTAEQHQAGWQNDADIDQNAERSWANQVQVNDKKDLLIHRGWDVNQAYIKQFGGENNVAHQMQYFEKRARPNIANAVQNGDNHYSEEVQIGGFNDSDVHQIGDGNKVNVYQNTNNVPDPNFKHILPFNY